MPKYPAMTDAQVNTAVRLVCDHTGAFTLTQVQNIAENLAGYDLSLAQLDAVIVALTKSTPGFDPVAFTRTLYSTQRYSAPLRLIGRI